jgi:rhodanese-related sulfurtransferase
VAKKKTKRTPTAPPLRRVDAAELHRALEAGDVPVLVDVRTRFEFGSGHVAGSIHIPMEAISAADLPDEVWLICRSGNRSATVAQQLAQQGKRVVDVAGGTAAWSAAGHPLVGSQAGGLSTLMVPLMASLTLGLAPWLPEPHIVGKLRWVAGGAVGLTGTDWFDLAMHGAPWVWLLWSAARLFLQRSKQGASV